VLSSELKYNIINLSYKFSDHIIQTLTHNSELIIPN